MEKLLVFILLFIIKTPFIWSQVFDDLRNYNHPEFAKSNSDINEKKSLINLDCNQFAFFSEKSTNWFYLYTEIQKMIAKKDRKLNFYHIGSLTFGAILVTIVSIIKAIVKG